MKDRMLINKSDWEIKVIPASYRMLTLVMAAAFIFGFGNHRGWVVSSSLLFGLALLELVVSSVPPFIVPQGRTTAFGLSLSFVSAAICLLLLALSGGVESPFVLFSLSPIISSALFSTKKHTLIKAGILCAAVILIDVLDPFQAFQLSAFSASQMAVYVIAAFLIVTLPYETNINLRQRLEHKNIVEERLRLSREIHDGVAQTLHALCWQVQRVRSHAAPDDKEVEQLEKLAEKARCDILQAMDALRNRMDENDLRTLLVDCLEDFKQDYEIDYYLSIETGDIQPAGEVKKELVSICREALANIKKHSGARSVRINLKQVRNFIEFSIIDDGKGFDAASLFQRRVELKDHHGLEMMREKAQLINGKFRVLSLPDHGTEVKIEVPMYEFKGRA